MIRWLFITAIFAAAINAFSQKKDTLRLFYLINQDEPDKAKLDSFISSLNGILTEAEIIGYADFLAGNDYNLSLSRRRANNVKDYLNHKTKTIEIIGCRGAGELPSHIQNKQGVPLHRRVDVVFSSKLFIHEEPNGVTVPFTDTSVVSENNLERSIENLDVGESMSIEGLSFIPGQHYPMNESLPVLKKLLETLEKNKQIKIEIQGHVCCTSDAEDGYDLATGEKKLSENRAKYVYDYLVNKGINPDRLTYKGYGRTRPKAPFERNAAEEQMNRRVEIKILGK